MAGDPALQDRRVGIAQVKSLMFRPNCHCSLPALGLAEEVGLFEADESADPDTLAHRRAEVDVAGALLGHPEHDVHVYAVLGLVFMSGGGIGCWKKFRFDTFS